MPKKIISHPVNLSRTKTYISWQAMKRRCLNPNSDRYQFYGGRGIKVCDRWMEFSGFLEDMKECPDGFTLERINNEGNYEPENCRWASRKDQANNRRSSRLLTVGGITKTMSQWSDESGVSIYNIWQRIHVLKWDIERAVTTPILKMT